MLKNLLSQICSSSKLRSSGNQFLQLRQSLSAWIDPTKASSSNSRLESLDVERLFTNHEVQKLLQDLTGVDLERIFAERVFDKQERSHFALMTEKMYQNSLEKMKEEGRHFLQFVPVKEPRPNTFEILSKDPEIAGYDNSKFIFVDITFDSTNQNRTVVVRETDGTLRTATPEERDRMNRIYFAQPERPVNEPALFKDPFLKEALDRNDHEYVLDYACYFFEPDDPAFVKFYREVFDRTVAQEKFKFLYSTRHFGPLVFYLVINDNMNPLLDYIASTGSLSNVAKVIRLYKIVHPDWRVAIGSEDSDRKIVLDFLKQNRNKATKLGEVVKLLAEDSREADSPAKKPSVRNQSVTKMKLIDKDTLRSSDGPLGDLASEYSVKLAKSSYDKEGNQDMKSRKMSVYNDKKDKLQKSGKPIKKS